MLGGTSRKAPAPGEDVSGPEPDPRESEERFLRLDADAQDLVRSRWLQDELQWERVTRARRSELSTSIAEGALLLVGIQLLLVVTLGMFLRSFTGGVTLGAAIAQLLLAAVVGTGLGAAWSVVGAGVMTCALSAIVAVACVEWLVVGSGWISVIALITAPVLAGFAGQYGSAAGGSAGILTDPRRGSAATPFVARSPARTAGFFPLVR